jgi:Xaa-Pro aminopeptidase
MILDTNFKTILKKRRTRFLDAVGDSGIAILVSAKEHLRSVDWTYPYRQSSDFFYLTHFVEPNSVIVFAPKRKEGEFIIFSEEHNAEKESWFGPIIGQTNACKVYDADQAFPITLLDKIMPDLLGHRTEVYFDIGLDAEFDSKIFHWVNQIKAKSRTGINAPYKFIDIGKIIHEMRLIKDEFEISQMRKSAKIAVAAHARAMKKCEAGLYEYELAAEIIYEFTKQGGNSPSFQTIIGGGANSCVLHYTKNDQPLKNGDLVVVDAGVEYDYYSSDITRTYPVNGHFSPEQKAIYEIVLEAQTSTINKIKPGVSWFDLQINAQKVITEGLVSLGILKGSINELLETKAFRPFYWHNIGHWLGIDNHDVGEYKHEGLWRALKSGMVTTVEPGIYIAAQNQNVDPKWWNIGVRIEDDVLVTDNGYEVLTTGLPKTIADVETFMKK